MANVIKPRRTTTASKVPTTSDLADGEFGVNSTDKKSYIRAGASVVQIGAGALSGLGDVTVSSPANGEVLSYNGSAWVNATSAGGSQLIFTGFDGGTASTSVFDLTLDLGGA